MPLTRLIIFFFAGLLLTSGCTNIADTKPANKDAVQEEKEPQGKAGTEDENCKEVFFKNLPRFKDSSGAYLLLANGKRKSLTQFFKDEFLSPVSEYGVKDLDSDGIKELVIFNFTGGPHCCDEYFIFSQKNDLEFEYKAQLTGGQACINQATNVIMYSFSETLGYFFSCYSCEFRDSSGGFKRLREIQLKFNGSAMQIIPYDKVAEKQNLYNLQLLQQHGFEELELMMDNGWRKEFAMNLALWYYNHGKNHKQTKALFDKYYHFPDASKVWTEFYRTLMELEKENDF